ncbi:hypothetical protein COHA_006615 [Chlorella ohadii]|uniref:Uncharacterized protein n=1 Tax=Chlorella ohadii TaxID=2649997 RepID=A0AAD5H475_9CHLO|nr:hypothetical protein COHA_006615 [Chlorella ohadii]
MGQAIASGIFNLTGGAALQAGAAILLSYLLAGATALCCAAVMAEFARELPISGAGFTWTITTLGELPAMFVLGNTLAGQVLGNAAVSRGFSYFLAQLCGRPPTFFNVGSSSVNPVAFGINVVITLLVATGVRESAFFITGLTLLHLLMLSIVMVAGFTQANPANLQPFFSGGADNCIDAAGILFFTFIGMEAPAVGAEEAHTPSQLPAAIIGNASVAVLVYFFMALSLLMMVPAAEVGTPAVPVSAAEYRANAFTAAFSAAGLGHWNSFVLVTAMLGTLTSLVTLMYSCSRIVMVGARDRLLPPQLSRVSKRTQTPAMAQLLVGAIISIISLLTSTASLQRFTVICYIVTYFVIANAMMVRRYLPGGSRLRCSSFMTVEAGPTIHGSSGCLTWLAARRSIPWRRALFLLHLAALNGLSIAAATVFQTVTFQPARASPGDTASPPFSSWLAVVVLLGGWAAATLSLQLWVPLEYEPTWHIPRLMMPWVPSFALLLIPLALSSLPGDAWVHYAVWCGILAAFYLLYSLPASYLRHYAPDWQNKEELK